MDTRIVIEETASGLQASFKGKDFFLTYPKEIWQSYPDKIRAVLVDNLAHLLTINLPVVARLKELHYSTALPAFQPFFRTVVLRSVPAAIESYSQSTQDVLKRILNIDYHFDDHQVKIPVYEERLGDRAIVLFSAGKDSLLTLAVAHELGLNPVAIYVNDTVSPKENRMKKSFARKLSEEKNIPVFEIVNEFEQLNDFETWDKPASCLGYSHMLTGFCFLALPFMHFFKSKYVFVGNQRNMNFSFVNKDGFKSFPSFDQMWGWTKHQSTLVSFMTNHQGTVSSIIEPLTNLAEVKVLFYRYPGFAKYQISCDHSDTLDRAQRWCYACPKCARLFLFMKAHGVNVKAVGFGKNLFNRQSIKYFSLFNGQCCDEYERSAEASDEQLLGFYLAYKRGAKGYLIDRFRRDFCQQAKEREEELHRKFLLPHSPKTIPKKLKSRVMSIYNEELKN